MSVRVGWKQRALVFSVKLSNANPVSTWIGERLTLPSTADISCLFVFCLFVFFLLLFFLFFFVCFFFFVLFFSLPTEFFYRHFVTHSNNSVCMCSADAFS